MAGLSSAQGLELLKSGRFSDFIITCRDREFNVHRNILSQAGAFFKTLTEGSFKENVSGLLDLPEEHPTIVARALVYIYTGEFSIDIDRDYSDVSHMRCDVSHAKQHSETHSAAEGSPSCPASSLEIGFLTYMLADKHGMERLRTAAFNEFMGRSVQQFSTNEFADALKKVYEEGPGDAAGLRLAVTRLCITKHKKVKENAALLDIIEAHEPMAFRCVAKDIKDEHLGECWEHSSELRASKIQAGKLVKLINDKKACRDCGAQFSVTIKEQAENIYGPSGGYDLLCSDCGEPLDSTR